MMRHLTLAQLEEEKTSHHAHARVSVHGEVARFSDEEALAILDLLPRWETPGFDLISPRAMHLWLALLGHARNYGKWYSVGVGELRHRELCAEWTVAAAARAMGIHRNQAGAALGELTDFGFVRIERCRSKGQFRGFKYAFLVPTRLSTAGEFKLEQKLKAKHMECADVVALAVRYMSDEKIRRLLHQADVEHSKQMQEELEESQAQGYEEDEDWDDEEDEDDREWESR